MARVAAPALAPVERTLFLLVAAACLVFTVLTPPFQAPDEPQHLSRSVRLARGAVFAETRDGRIGGKVPRGYARLAGEAFPREAFGVPTRYALDDLRRAARPQPTDDTPVFVEFANVANYAPTLYLPQAVGIAIGERLGLSTLGTFYLARLVNVLAFLALLWGAVRALPFGRVALLGIAALPTVAYQGASVSPDATINGLGWFVLALSLAVGHGAVQRAPRGWLVAASVPLGLCKGLYAPLALAGAKDRRSMIWCALAFAAGAAAFLGWTLAAGGDQATYIVESRRTGQLVSTAPLSDQVRVVLGDPLGYVRTLVSSMVERSPVYALQLVGRFGWNAILLPLAVYALAAAMVICALATGLGRSVGAVSRLWWALVAIGVIVLVETALYLTGTPLGADYVQGTQGRYFLPALPLLIMALTPARALRLGRWRPERWLVALAVAVNMVAILAALDAFWLHGFTNVRGLPPILHDPGGLARALLLPSPRW